MLKEKPLPVIIRYEGKGKADRKDWHVRDLVAFFPTEPGTDDPRYMSCYAAVGQHSAAMAGYIGRATKPATGTQIAAMMLELRAAGYNNLHLVSRASPAHARARREALTKEHPPEGLAPSASPLSPKSERDIARGTRW